MLGIVVTLVLLSCELTMLLTLLLYVGRWVFQARICEDNA